MSCHDCLNRRRFLALAAGGAAAAALAACGDGDVSGIATKVTSLTPGGGGGGTTGGGGGGSSQIQAKVSDYPGLANVGELVMITNTFVAVKRTGPTGFDALFMACTHEGCLCSIVSNAFECPCHGSKFDNNGTVTVGPATSNLAKLQVAYDASTNTITIN